MKPKEFFETIAPHAVEDMHATGVLASVTLAQAALESNWGKSAPNHNLFGIKGKGSTQTTKEYINGQWVTVVDGFRAYDSWIGSIKDHSQFLIENGRYANNGFFECCKNKDYRGACWSLQRAQYATDPDYANKLISIIDNWNLHEYDKVEMKEKGDDEEMKLELWQWTMLGDAITGLSQQAQANGEPIISYEWAEKAYKQELTSSEALFMIMVSLARSKGIAVELRNQ